MKRLGLFSKISQSNVFRKATTGFAIAIVGSAAYAVGVPVWKEFKNSFAYRDFQKYGVLGTYRHRFFGVFGKMDEIEAMDRENIELNSRLAQLEKKFEVERARNASAEMKEITQDLSDKLRDEAGTELARVLTAISYPVPTHLLPHQQYALALGYFRKQEYEQAAVLFNHLLNLQDDKSYQRGEVQLLSAIAWYHLKHYKLSRHYLRAVVKNANRQTSLYRTSVLWEAILAKAEGNKVEAQRRLTAALAQFPHSVEASWVNTGHETKAHATKGHAEKETGRHVASHSEREPNQAWMRQQELKNKAEHGGEHTGADAQHVEHAGEHEVADGHHGKSGTSAEHPPAASAAHAEAKVAESADGHGEVDHGAHHSESAHGEKKHE